MTNKELQDCLPDNDYHNIIVMDSVDSTNSYLKNIASKSPEGTVVLASSQTGGRGRRGHSFLSDRGGIYLSMLVRPTENDISTITARTAVAVCDAIEAAAHVRPGIKWVNDLMLGGKKLGGILVEGVCVMGKITHIIIGIGLNVNTEAFDLSIINIATSLKNYTGCELNLSRLAAEIITRLDRMCAQWDTGKTSAHRQYLADCQTVGQRIRFEKGGRAYRGIAAGLAEDFSLLVQLDSGETARLDSGEISVLAE